MPVHRWEWWGDSGDLRISVDTAMTTFNFDSEAPVRTRPFALFNDSITVGSTITRTGVPGTLLAMTNLVITPAIEPDGAELDVILNGNIIVSAILNPSPSFPAGESQVYPGGSILILIEPLDIIELQLAPFSGMTGGVATVYMTGAAMGLPFA